MPTMKANLRVASSAETELEKALRELGESSAHGAEHATVHLASACAASRNALAGIAPGERPLPWRKLSRSMRTDEQAQACYARAAAVLLSGTASPQPLPGELLRASAHLFRELSATCLRSRSNSRNAGS